MSKEVKTLAAQGQLSGYSLQVILILDFKGGTVAAGQLKTKWESNKNNPEKCIIIQVFSPNELYSISQKFSALSELDSNSRLYIIVHGVDSRSGFLGSDSTGKTHYYSQSLIANFLANYLQPDENIKISMIACNIAEPSGKKNYFKTPASELHLRLYNKGLNTTLLARTKKMRTIMDPKRKLVFKQTLNNLAGDMKHKQPGSKVIYRFNKIGKQIVEDAYFAKWKTQSLKAILQCQKYASRNEQVEELRDLCSKLQKKSPAKVLEELKRVLAVKYSFIIHKNFIGIWKKQDIKEVFKNLIEEGEKIYVGCYVKTRCRKIEMPADTETKEKDTLTEVHSDSADGLSFDELEKRFKSLSPCPAADAEIKSNQPTISLESEDNILTGDDSDSADCLSFEELESRYHALVLNRSIWNKPPCASSELEKSSPSTPSVPNPSHTTTLNTTQESSLKS